MEHINVFPAAVTVTYTVIMEWNQTMMKFELKNIIKYVVVSFYWNILTLINNYNIMTDLNLTLKIYY